MAASRDLPRNLISNPHSFLTQSANLVSASRLILACIWVVIFFAHRSHPQILRAIALGGAVSDLIDGHIARWTHSTSRFGRWLDNTADIVFILTVLSCETYAGVIPIYLPALIAASFAQYVADSVLIRGSAVPVKSRLGHWAGVFNYIIVIVLAWAPPPRLLGTLLRDLAPMIGLFYVAAMCERALSYDIAHGLHGVTTIKPAAGE
ncbi:MAG: CDP-alcohol phosphatidyltransferase family protein [Deltaproteobacteria bacterium]|nr:CDP-alcohol phosphatidyltransferase family protein [Deltaproteobacteria bacterium]